MERHNTGRLEPGAQACLAFANLCYGCRCEPATGQGCSAQAQAVLLLCVATPSSWLALRVADSCDCVLLHRPLACFQGLRYAWLTTYDRLWVVKMQDERTMLVSRP